MGPGYGEPMNASPLMMPRRKTDLAPAIVAYTTTTGDAPRDARATSNLPVYDDYTPYCFVCRRVTDHAGEHESLVEAGLAEYGDGGTVRRTAAWDDDKAAAISQAEYVAYCAAVGIDAHN